jgi:hypothetical protein
MKSEPDRFFCRDCGIQRVGLFLTKPNADQGAQEKSRQRNDLQGGQTGAPGFAYRQLQGILQDDCLFITI